MKNKLPILLIVLFIAGKSFASGFQINEHGAKAMAMAGAFTGVANDASAVYFNPAAIVNLSGTRISGGVTFIQPSSTFRGVSPSIDETEMDTQTFTPINLYVTHKLNEDWAFGFSLNNPFGLGTKWDNDWVGRYIAIDTEVRTFFFGANAAYKITDQLSAAVGINFVYGDVKIQRYSALAPFEGDTYVELEGDGTAWGFNAAIFYQPSEQWSFGVSYRGETKLEFKGDATNDAPVQMKDNVPSGKINAELRTPMNLSFGAGFYPTKQLTISADFQYIGWSSYDKLEVNFEEFTFSDGSTKSSAPRDYENSFIARLGAEYVLESSLALRCGLLYDNNPVKDELVEPTLPDADRIGFNIGLGYDITENLVVDLAYLFLRFEERKIDNSDVSYTDGAAYFNGVYNSVAHLLGINFSYKF